MKTETCGFVAALGAHRCVPSRPISIAYHCVPDYLACEVGEVAQWWSSRSGLGEEALRWRTQCGNEATALNFL